MSPPPDVRPAERMAAALASLILDPAAAGWLVRESGHDVRLSPLHKPSGNSFTAGTRELFDLTGQGRINRFFLGGGQIDGQANINLIGTGCWPGTGARFPGSFGSAFMYRRSCT